MPGPESLLPNDPNAFGAYSVVGRVGKGGQGVVYLGEDAEGDKYAIKVLNDDWAQDEDLRKRFEKEVRAAQKVASFCTAAIHEANLDEDPPYVVSEYVEGMSLQESVAKDGPHKRAALQRLAVSTATALVAIHQAGIVHRDFKPGNVLLGQDGPRVIDFGIARVADGTATMTNSIMGTPSYMAPEQIEGTGITAKADIFSWGCVMAYASTGNTPFGSDSVPAVVHRVVSAPPSLDGMPESLHPVVSACLEKDPAQRPTAQSLLMRLLGHEGGDSDSTADAVEEGERIAESGAPASGPQAPPAPGVGGQPSGPQAPPSGPGMPSSGPQMPPPQPNTGAERPMSGPQPGSFAPQPPPMGPPGPQGPPTQGPQPQMPGPGTTGQNPGMGQPPPPPHTGGQNAMYQPGMNPQQPQYSQPQYSQQHPMQQPEDPILSQGWVVPAVLVSIIILLLLLVLVALSG